MAVEQSEKRF